MFLFGPHDAKLFVNIEIVVCTDFFSKFSLFLIKFLYASTEIMCSYLFRLKYESIYISENGKDLTTHRVFRKSHWDFRLLQYRSRDGHDEEEHVDRGRETPSLSYVTGARLVHPW